VGLLLLLLLLTMTMMLLVVVVSEIVDKSLQMIGVRVSLIRRNTAAFTPVGRRWRRRRSPALTDTGRLRPTARVDRDPGSFVASRCQRTVALEAALRPCTNHSRLVEPRHHCRGLLRDARVWFLELDLAQRVVLDLQQRSNQLVHFQITNK